MVFISGMSVRERNLWGEMLLHIIISVYFIPKMFVLMSLGGEALVVGGIWLVIKSIILSVVLTVVANVVLAILNISVKPEARDEREKEFVTRSYLIAYGILSVGVLLIMSGIMMSQFNEGVMIALLTPGEILQWLWVVLIVASIFRSGTQLFYYRRGY